jgi:hypothetical protein
MQIVIEIPVTPDGGQSFIFRKPRYTMLSSTDNLQCVICIIVINCSAVAALMVQPKCPCPV